jgi:CAAX prenyl protease-like protein
MAEQRKGHGWGGYFWPYISFLGIIEISRRFPEEYGPVFLGLKVAVPLGLLAWYFRRGAYPELRGHAWSFVGVLQDVAVGVLGAAIWMAPFILSDSLRPEAEGAFDPEQFGPSLAWLALSVRAIGYGVATPFIEELFVRSWLQRYVEVYDKHVDFRDIPIGAYSRRSLLVVAVWFTFTHVQWEWPVALAWILGTQLWFYHRKSLVSMVIVHSASNLSILGFVMAFTGVFRDGEGLPIDLWFFV